MLVNAAKVGFGRAPDFFPSSGCERSSDYARVSRITLSTYETFLLESVHDPCEPARRDHDALGELAHRELPIFGASKAQQHIVLGEGELVPATELGVQDPRDLMVRMEKSLPGVHLRVAKLFPHDLKYLHSQINAIYFALQ